MVETTVALLSCYYQILCETTSGGILESNKGVDYDKISMQK